MSPRCSPEVVHRVHNHDPLAGRGHGHLGSACTKLLVISWWPTMPLALSTSAPSARSTATALPSAGSLNAGITANFLNTISGKFQLSNLAPRLAVGPVPPHGRLHQLD